MVEVIERANEPALNLDERTGKSGDTALILAASQGADNTCSELLRRGASADVQVSETEESARRCTSQADNVRPPVPYHHVNTDSRSPAPAVCHCRTPRGCRR